ncbi:MAG: cytochrome c oxidase subunit I [Bdellovibrionaceae bacterium]|nr:cytochrome c oxidase subunit I [Pseudobdellovibrionaceae bacterium]
MATAQANAGVSTNYISEFKGLKSWFVSLDHKRIAILYMVSVLFFFLIGGLAALLIRLELWAPGTTVMSPDAYNQAMTYHGAIMVFMVIVPGIPAILGNFLLPLHLGAKDVAFPRLNLASWYIFILGALMAVSTLFVGKVDTGWTFYTPYSIKTSGAVVLMVLAVFIMGMSSVLTGLNFIATVHKLRCPGMTMHRMPLFVWAIYSTAILQVLATPVLGITLLLIAVERIFGIGIFDSALGGDPVLFQHFFWFYSHPAVYIMIIPAMGIISELVTTFSRKTIFGYTAIAYSSLGIAAVSFFVWGHHMYVSGQSEIAGVVFSFLTMLVGVPTAIKMFNWVGTMYRGSIQFASPMLFAFGFLFLFAIGGVTGIMLATLATDVHFHDTYFVVAHFHYVMVGGTLMALLGGFYFWFPKMFGKMVDEGVARITFVLTFVGFNVTFFPQFILGAMGMPRRYFDYIPAYESLNKISTVGSWLIALGFFLALYAIIKALISGEKAPDNPWGAKTLEWQTSSPPPTLNFNFEPSVNEGPYEYR